MFDPRVSMWASALSDQMRIVALSSVLARIRDGGYAEQVERLRALKATDPEAYQRQKRALPAFCVSGTARDRRTPLEHSGLLQVDLDKLGPQALPAIRDRVAGDPHVQFGFTSPGGDGLKLGLRIDGARHADSFRAAEAYFEERYGLDIDPACKDRLRLCFVSHDPAAWAVESAEQLPIPEGLADSSTPTVEALADGEGAKPSAFIILPSGTVSISDCARDIFQRITPSRTVFWRGGALVEPTETDGQQTLTLLRPEHFRTRAEAFGRLYAWRAGRGDKGAVLSPSKMSADDALAIMASAEARRLPNVASVLRCPVIVQGGQGEIEILGRGYHEALGGLLVTAGEAPPQLSPDEARAALSWLVEEFDFQSPGDRARALAAFLTPALRLGGHLTGPVPIDAAESDQSQAGKGYRHSLVCALYNESPYIVTARQGGVGSVDESFSAALLGARPFICLDNLRGRLDSQTLEAFVTAPGHFPARVPHRGEVLIDPRRFLLQASSNGLESTRDLMNRASIVRIRKRPGYQYRDTLGELRAQQPRFLGAVFSLVAEWIAAGKPHGERVGHDFREWGGALDWICQTLLGTGPLFDGHGEAQERASNPALSWLRAVALAVEREGRLGQDLIASEIAELCAIADVQIPGLREWGEDTAKRQVGTLARRLFGADGTELEVDGFRVTRGVRLQPREDGSPVDLKTYRFERGHQGAPRPYTL